MKHGYAELDKFQADHGLVIRSGNRCNVYPGVVAGLKRTLMVMISYDETLLGFGTIGPMIR